MTSPDNNSKGDIPFQSRSKKPTEDCQFGSHHDDWWLNISYAEDGDMEETSDTDAQINRAEPKK